MKSGDHNNYHHGYVQHCIPDRATNHHVIREQTSQCNPSTQGQRQYKQQRQPQPMQVMQPTTMNHRIVLLTVGDGDLSASLALLRAYHYYEKKSQDEAVGPPPAVAVVDHVVATTLISSREEWMQVYPSSAPSIWKELEESYASCCTILYGVDATQLHRNVQLKDILKEQTYGSNTTAIMDLVILFQYPHLGYSTDTTSTTAAMTSTSNESNVHNATTTTTHSSSASPSSSLTNDHALRHSTLVAHYLDSAKQLLISLEHSTTTADTATAVAPSHSLDGGGGSGCIHVCLTSGAIASWNLMDIVQRLDLTSLLEAPHPASRPLLEPLVEKLQQKAINNNNDTQDKDHSQQPASSTTTTTSSATKKNKALSCGGGGGSRKGHWLGKYGYRHQPTFPQHTEFQTNVSSSYHFFFQPTTTATTAAATADSSVSILDMHDDPRQSNDNHNNRNNYSKEKTPQRQYQCPICLQGFPKRLELQEHAAAPARPPPP